MNSADITKLARPAEVIRRARARRRRSRTALAILRADRGGDTRALHQAVQAMDDIPGQHNDP